MSPYGGAIRYWDQILAGLVERGVPVAVDGPTSARARLPPTSSAAGRTPRRWLVHPTTTLAGEPPRGQRIVISVHDTIYEDDPDTARTLDADGRHRARHERWIRAAAQIVTPSAVTARGLERHHPDLAATVTVVPEGVARTVLDPDTQAAAALADRLAPHDTGRPFLLHVGGRELYKDFRWLLAAYVAGGLSRTFDLMVVGSQPHPLPAERPHLSGCRPGAVRYLGHVPDAELGVLYRQASAYVTASRREGFGLPAVEAAACGTPVACSATPIFAETVGPHAETFAIGDEAAFARAVGRAVQRPVGARHDAATEMRARFDWGRTVDRTIAVYARAAA